MANATPLTMTLLRDFVHTYVTATAAGSNTLNLEPVTIADFLTKCARMITNHQNYNTDKFSALNGELLPAGGFTEEYFVDPTMPQDYDKDGTDTLKPNDASFRKNYYALSLPRKMIKTTLRYNEFYPGVMNIAQAEAILNEILAQWVNSRELWLMELKRMTLGNAITKFLDVNATTTTFAAGTAYEKGAYLRSSASGTIKYGVVYKDYTASAATSWDDAVAKGYIVEENLIDTISEVTDESTGEDFILAVKKQVEIFGEPFQGGSLSGNLLGNPEGLTMYVRFGVMPTLDVKTLAGAFNQGRLAIPARIVPIKTFGKGVDDKVVAFLADDRIAKVHEQFQVVRTQENADGDFRNFVFHYAPLARVSYNVYGHIFKTA